MKKVIVICLLLGLIVAAAVAQGPVPTADEIKKNLQLVEQTQPVSDKMKPGYDSINGKEELQLLRFLSSDLLEGREIATNGYDIAANYAASLLTLWKLQPGGDQPRAARPTGMAAMMGAGEQPPVKPERSFLQEFELKEVTDFSSQMTMEVHKEGVLKKRTFQSGLDYTYTTSLSETLSAPVVFAGYGIREKDIAYDDFDKLDVKGKIVIVLADAPGRDNPNSPFQKKELKEKYFPEGPMRRGGGFQKALEAEKLGAVAVLSVQSNPAEARDIYKSLVDAKAVNDERPIIKEPRRQILLPGSGSMPWERTKVVNISRELANALLESSGQKLEDLQQKIETTGKPASLDLPGVILRLESTVKTTLVRSENVIAYIEGSDPALKDEVVVIGAHLDHLGHRGDYVFNGADDNGSGSVGVLEIAKAFVLNPQKPKRTVVFCLWTGEEEGLLGSRYYVKNPAFPMKKTVAYLNLDMIGTPLDERMIKRYGRMFNMAGMDDLLKKIKPANFINLNRSADSAAIGEAIRQANLNVGFDLLQREASREANRAGGGSDHASFAMAQVPWVFFIAGMNDQYHQPGDSIEKLGPDFIEKMSRLIYLTAYNIADK